MKKKACPTPPCPVTKLLVSSRMSGYDVQRQVRNEDTSNQAYCIVSENWIVDQWGKLKN
jgi:hypothetical protein